jgi:enoyl-[acyl-carrier protein] reductase I
MKLFEGKKALIFGVANERSIAWGIAQKLHEEGAELAFTYVNQAIEKRLRPLAESLGCNNVFPCDVQNDAEITNLYSELSSRWGKIDALVHSVAFANGDDLKCRFSDTSRAGFALALDVSAYSLIAVARGALPLMKDNGGAILTLSYLGAQRVVQNYNVMGVAKAALESSVRYLAADLGQDKVRVNAISAGPIKTLAAAGIPNFRELLSSFEQKSPLRRNVTQEDVAKSSLFYLSDLSSGITGETTYVDCGYNILGL